ncbi:hypothetical protein C8R44DRAFT_747680 [Mycena epipterygia]|nr:hypothetical protein C8R44DRAFT_747680 [Mycena epipterygia]
MPSRVRTREERSITHAKNAQPRVLVVKGTARPKTTAPRAHRTQNVTGAKNTECPHIAHCSQRTYGSRVKTRLREEAVERAEGERAWKVPEMLNEHSAILTTDRHSTDACEEPWQPVPRPAGACPNEHTASASYEVQTDSDRRRVKEGVEQDIEERRDRKSTGGQAQYKSKQKNAQQRKQMGTCRGPMIRSGENDAAGAH